MDGMGGEGGFRWWWRYSGMLWSLYVGFHGKGKRLGVGVRGISKEEVGEVNAIGVGEV